MPLPPYYLRVILISGMAYYCYDYVWERDPSGALSSFLQKSWRNQYMAPLLLTIGSLSLGETMRILVVLPPLKWVCMPYLPQIFFTETLCIRYNNMTIGFNFIGGGLGTCSVLIVNSIINLPGRPVKPFLHLVQSPFRVFALGECLSEVIHFLAEKLRIVTHCLGPIGEGVNNPKFCWEVVVIVPL